MCKIWKKCARYWNYLGVSLVKVGHQDMRWWISKMTRLKTSCANVKTLVQKCTTYLRNLLSASRVDFRISVVNSNAAHVGLSSPHPVFQVLEPVVALTEAVTVIWVATSSPGFWAMCLFFGSDRFELIVCRWIPFLTLELTSAFWSIFGANRKISTVGSTNLSTVRHTELRKIYIKIFNVIYLLKSYLSERDRSKSRSVHGKLSGKFKKWVKTLLI